MSNTGDNAELIELLQDKSEDGAFSDFERHLFIKSAQAITSADARIAELEKAERFWRKECEEKGNVIVKLAEEVRHG